MIWIVKQSSLNGLTSINDLCLMGVVLTGIQMIKQSISLEFHTELEFNSVVFFRRVESLEFLKKKNQWNKDKKCCFPLAEARNKQKTFFSHTSGSLGASVRGV